MKVAVVLVMCLLQVVSGANPNYSYHVKIDDPAHINFQEKAETRKGEDAQGFYSVLEPNGALRTVSYIADERGFNPVVSYSYGHPQSSVTVHSATGAAVVRQPGVYAPAYVTDNRVQITDKSNIYAAPPPALNVQAFALPGPSAPVVVSQPLRQAVPVVKASAAIAANYAPAYVPPPAAYLPPPQPQVLVQPQPQIQPQVLAVPQPQVLAVPQPRPQVLAVAKPQVLAVPQPQVQFAQEVIGLAPPPVTYVKRVRPAKVLAVPAAVPAVKVVKTRPVIATDSYSVPPRDTFRDPNAPSYPDAVPAKVSEPTAEYGPPAYVPPAPLAIAEPPPVKVVQPVAVAKVVQPVAKVVQPLTVAKYVQPPPVVQQVAAVQKVVAQPAYVNNGLYAGAIGFHTHTTAPQSYIHSYGTQGFQVTSSRQYNKAILTVPKQIVRAPTPVYGPPPAVAVQTVQKVVQPAPAYLPPPPAVAIQQAPQPVYGPPPAVAIQQAPQPVYGPPPAIAVQQAPVRVRVVQPKPVYGPPPTKLIQPQFTAVAVPAPPPPAPVVQTAAVAAAVPAAPLLQAPIAAPVAITGKKQNPLTFAYSYDQGGAKVTHSYSGSGW